MSSSSPQSRAMKLSERIMASNQSANLLSVRHHAPEGWPAWYRQLLVKLGVIDKADLITYLSSTVTNDDQAGGTVFALTKNLAIMATATALRSAPYRGVELSVWSRATLEEVRILEADDYSIFEVDEADVSPRFLQLELRYAGRPPVTLPLADRAGEPAHQELSAQYGELLADVAG